MKRWPYQSLNRRSTPLAIALLVILTGIALPVPTYAQIASRNINMVSGTQWPSGDPFLQRQNEPSLAVSTRNPLHLIAGANDYRTVDLPGLAGGETGDAWVGLFKSLDGGQTWSSSLVPGYPQDTSPSSASSPMKAFQAAADPVVRAGTNGLFYYSSLVFNRGANAPSAIVVSRFIDNNNNEAADPIQFLGTTTVATGANNVFLDKGWMAVDVPRAGALVCTLGNPQQLISAGNVYVAYTAFAGDESHGAIMFSRSRDCGATWSQPIQIAASTSTNQGATIAIQPSTGAVYVAWRRFASATDIDALMFSRSTDGGLTFSAPSVASLIAPFDQPTSAVSFRTNAYPSMAVDGNGLIYLGWAQRGVGPGGDARIVVATSNNGGVTWTAPVPVDNPAARGHQIMPSLSYVGGILAVLYYDQRDDTTTGTYSALGGGLFNETRTPLGDLATNPAHPEKVFTSGIVDAASSGTLLRRHTLDVRVAQSTGNLQFTSTKVSKYPIGSRPNSKLVEQLQMNAPNLPMFALGTVPFMGDYIDIAGLAFVKDANGNWIYNTAASNTTVFRAVWTDNRDVRPPADGNWAHYIPPASLSSQPASIFDPNQPQPACDPNFPLQSGSRNQNIYTAVISRGLLAHSPANAKALSSTTPRAFVLSLQNTTSVAKTFRMAVANQPPGGRASFGQRSSSSTSIKLDVTIAPSSSISRTVFVQSSVAQAQVRIDIAEVTAPNGTVVAGGLQSSILLNPDPTNPANPAIQNAEIYNPDVSNPDVSNPDVSNPDVSNPDVSNPDVSNVVVANPDVSNPDVSNADVSNPDVSNPDVSNPDVSNPDVSNGTFKDVTWVVKNKGNTYSSYTIKTLLASNFPSTFKKQLIISRIYTTPVSVGCSLKLQTTTEVLTNIVNPVFSTFDSIGNPDVSNAAIGNATLSLAPNDTARITLRVVNPDKNTNTNFDASKAVVTSATSHAVDTPDLAAGSNQPPVGASQLVIVAMQLPSGQVGTLYPSTTLLASGGTTPFTWTLPPGNLLPPGLLLSPAGVISGTPTTQGTYNFNVKVTDSGVPQQTYTNAFSILIAPQKPLVIASTSVPNGYVGVAYSYTLVASGGIGSRTWQVTTGALPPGVTLGLTTGSLTGTPQVLGNFNFTATVTDSSPVPLVTSQAFTLQVIPFSMVFTVQPVNALSNQNLSVQVKVQDSFGNGIAGLPVRLQIGTGGATVNDAVQDFSLASNPNGVWTYGAMSDFNGTTFSQLLAPVPATTCTSPAGGECWTNGGSFPNNASIIRNTTPKALSYSGTVVQPPDVLNLAVQNTLPAVRWTAAHTDTYTLSGSFSRIDTTPQPVNVRVLQDGNNTLFSSLNLTNGVPASFAFTNMQINAGETLDFYAGPGALPTNGSTGLKVTITGSGPVLGGSTVATTGANGVAVFNISITTPGTYTLKAMQPLATTANSNSFKISSALSCAPAPSGLISWWPGEGDAHDVGPGANNGAITGADGVVFFGPAKVNQGFLINNPSFDPSPQFIQVPHKANLNLTSAVTLESWVKLNSTPAPAADFVVAIKGANFENYGVYITNAGEISFQYFDGANFPTVTSSGAGLSTGALYHIAVTVDATAIKFYVNGVLVSQSAGVAQLVPNTEPFQIAADPPFGNNFDGTIDELTLYNRALTLAEIQSIFNAGTIGKCR